MSLPPDRGRRLLGAIGRIVRRHVRLTDAAADAVALWIAHTYAVTRRIIDVSPRLLITAPPGSGKTTLLRVVRAVADRSRLIIQPTAASLWRLLGLGPATLCLDEAHHTFGREDPDLLGVLDAGYEADGTVPRCVRDPDGHFRVVEHPVFSAVAMAMIGRPMETALLSRCVEVRLERARTRGRLERATRAVLRRYGSFPERLAAWIDSIAPTLRVVQPALPGWMADRTADLWGPLLALADLAGGNWPARARRAARRLSQESERAASMQEVDVGLRLLAELRDACPHGLDVWATRDILCAMSRVDDAPWADWRAGLTPHRLAKLLAEYGVGPVLVRAGPTHQPVRGYRMRDLERVWRAYLPPVQPTRSATCPGVPMIEPVDDPVERSAIQAESDP